MHLESMYTSMPHAQAFSKIHKDCSRSCIAGSSSASTNRNITSRRRKHTEIRKDLNDSLKAQRGAAQFDIVK